MKKFGKFILATLSLAAIIGGAFYFVKNVLNKDSNDDFDDFDDDFDDFDTDEDDDDTDMDSAPDKREYVTININNTTGSDEEELEEAVGYEAVDETDITEKSEEN